ncbi:MAG TPA: MBL fold metallo-hydrolase [Thermoanaerobaculia bacterium]
MRLHVLGSSGGFPVPDNPCSGFLLRNGGSEVWLDAGTGTFAALQQVTDHLGLEALVLSHRHPDHCADLLTFYVARMLHEGGAPRLPLYAPAGTLDVFTHFLPGETPEKVDKVFELREIAEGTRIEVGGIRMRFLRTEHPVLTLAVRAESPAGSLTYSADTGPHVDLAGFARGTDVLLCEATYQNEKRGAPVHLTAAEAGNVAHRARVGELLLTHIWPTFDPALSVQEAQTAAGEIPVRPVWAGDQVEVRRRG